MGEPVRAQSFRCPGPKLMVMKPAIPSGGSVTRSSCHGPSSMSSSMIRMLGKTAQGTHVVHSNARLA